MIIDEKTTFRDGFKRLMELKFGQFFNIIDTDSQKLFQYEENPPKLIIIENIRNEITERYLLKMRSHDAKVVLLTLEPDSFQEYVGLNIFDGFLLKKMPTNQLLTALEEIMEQDRSYVHPEFGYFFYKKILKSEKKGIITCV